MIANTVATLQDITNLNKFLNNDEIAVDKTHKQKLQRLKAKEEELIEKKRWKFLKII